jgi:2-polyprenyl-3-methyl-5-hydroxy-6-metoxy-1,4-benzoquinol methylase
MEQQSENGSPKLTKKEFWNDRGRQRSLPIQVNEFYYSEYRIARLFKEIYRSQNNPDIKVLEIGCGYSKWMHYFYSNLGVKKIFGIDYSEIGCSLTKNNLDIFGDSDAVQNVICGDIFHGPFKTESFDLIYNLGFIEHFENPFTVIELMTKLLKKKGMLITTVPNLKGLNGRLFKMANIDVFNMHKSIALEDLEDWYSRLELETEKLDYFGSFSLTASINWDKFAAKSVFHHFFSRRFIKIINALITFPLRLTGIEIESRFFSPFIVAVGKKI